MATIKKMKKAQNGVDSTGRNTPSRWADMHGFKTDRQMDSTLKADKAKEISRKLKSYNDSSVLKSTKKYKAGGSLSGLKASNKRVGPVDPKGAYTKVQEKTLAGAKGKAPLTKDKQLGATKMKKGGTMKKCKYGCK